MKILYYSPHPGLQLDSPSGYGRHMRGMIEAFQDLGHAVSLVFVGENLEIPSGVIGTSPMKRAIRGLMPGPIWETLKDMNLLRADRKAEQLLERAIIDEKPDLIYERVNYLQTSGTRVALVHRIPHISEMNAPYVEEKVTLEGKSLMTNRARRAERQNILGSCRIIVVSNALKNYFVKVHGVDADKFVVLPNAANPISEKEDVEVNNQKINKDKIEIGFVGSILPWHGVDLLINAFKKCTVHHQNIHLTIVGDGGTKSELVALAQNLGISEYVTFSGNVHPDLVFSHIQKMDICVMAKSNWYGSPVKIFEYGLFGKSIIAPDTGPVRDVMENEVHGLLTKPNADELYGHLVRLIGDAKLRIRLGAAFQKKVLAEHTWKKNAERALAGVL